MFTRQLLQQILFATNSSINTKWFGILYRCIFLIKQKKMNNIQTYTDVQIQDVDQVQGGYIVIQDNIL